MLQDSYETITLEWRDAHVLIVTLDRADVSNAMNTQMGYDLMHVFETLALDPQGARAVVLTGRGEKAFCGGGDLKQRRGMSDDEWGAQHLVFERMLRALLFCPLPVLASVNGAAFAGGCEIAAACDFIYAAPQARFALTEVTLGIMPGAGGTQNLPRAIGERRAKELILTGRPFSAEEALDWGFVNRIVERDDLLEETVAVARHIAGNAPLSVRQAKQSIARGLQMSLADGLAFEIEAYNRLVSTKDRREGVLAYNEKRRPVFEGR
ncbi:enoyl-CoA hydratase-related protein [Aliihoeflea sp. 2WW]|uniref:enoyl-CoA hydratase/isomerase family protein n=1 Tax=Aliihoeflea sp. 2WW TaxID=1381123 RepID=UPI0004A42CDA|nr:enoyl-CoA hydratase-related protein [Aliihoeflea sp. 2WW]